MNRGTAAIVDNSRQNLARTAALVFFLVFVCFDAVLGYYVLRDTIKTMKYPHALYMPLVIRDKDAPPFDESLTPAPTPSPEPTAKPTTAATVPLKITVQANDTLFLLAQQYGVSLDDLVAANQISNPDRISVGQELVIPGVQVTPAP